MNTFIQRTEVKYPAIIPDTKILKRCIKGLSLRARNEYSAEKREKIKLIRDEVKSLMEAL